MKLFYSANLTVRPQSARLRHRLRARGPDHQGDRPIRGRRRRSCSRANPLSKVPCLVTEDGLALFDSPVICEYLDDVGEGGLVPDAGPARWRALKLQAVADGVMDAAILRRREQGARRRRRPGRRRWSATKPRSSAALDVLEQDPPADHLDIGTISVACALGYLDFRFADEPGGPAGPHLEKWFEAMQQAAGDRQHRARSRSWKLAGEGLLIRHRARLSTCAGRR